MLVTVIISCLMSLLLLGRQFYDLSETARPFDLNNEWIRCIIDCNKCTRFGRMTTGNMSLNVSLPSTCSGNEWFLIVRLMVFFQIIVMDTVLNTNKLKSMIQVAQSAES